MTETLLALRDLKNSEIAKLFKTEKYFSVYGKTFIPYRKFESVREKQLIDSLSTSENMAVRVPKDNDRYSYSLKNFKRYTENFAVDIFYCVDDKRFCSPYKDGLRSLNVSKLRKFYASELVEYKKENKELISVLENRNLNAEIVRNNLKNALSKTAAEIQIISFSQENYDKLFNRAQINSPIEHIKLGKNQFEKLGKKHREKYLFLVYETLTKPSLVINEQRISDIGDEISHNYIKSFIDESKIEGFQSVVIKIENNNISITSHNRDLNNILSKIIMPEQLVYLRPEVGQAIEQRTQKEQSIVNQTKGMNLANESAYSTDISRPSNPYYDETKILSISNLIQKNNTPQEKIMENEKKFELDNENQVLEQLQNYLFYGKQPKGNKFVIKQSPAVFQYAGIKPLEIEFSTSVLNKAKKTHKMTNDEIFNSVKKIADPLLIFDSDKSSTENKKDSIILITDENVSAENKPSAVSMNLNIDEVNNQYKINFITSIHGRSLIAKNGVNIIEEWKHKGLLKYADDKKISSLAKAVSQSEPDIQEQFLLPLATLDIRNVPSKSNFVNQNINFAQSQSTKSQEDISKLHSALKDALREVAVPLEKIDFTKENFNKLFPRSRIETPIENVKLGANQFEKLEVKKRQNLLLAVHNTLKNPDLIINEQKENVFGEKENNHIYAKSFLINDKIHGIQSVVVSIDGENISISTHERSINNIVNKIKKPDQLLYAAAKVRLLVEQHTEIPQSVVNPIRENEYVVSPTSNIQQQSQSVKSTQEITKLQSALKDVLKEVAVPLEKIDFTRNNYNKLFPEGRINTPIENVKMGEHQFEKLEAKQREFILKATHDTLSNPDVIINEKRKNVFGEQEDSHLYAKSFLINDKAHGLQSVVVSIDGENVSISTHERDINNFVNKIKKPDQLLYAAAKVRLLVEQHTEIPQLMVNPKREFEYVKSLNQNIQQQSQSVKSTQEIATELVLEKLNQAKINVITEESAMQSILNAGIEVQKMAAHYGTNQNIENSESFNGYGVYVLSVNEENAKTLGLKIASKKYGNSFYINNQPLQEFLQERNFSPYWKSVINQIQNPSNENLLNQILTSDVKGNPTLLKEQSQLSTLCSLNLINYKREQTYLYSVEIPDNDGTNYLFYDKTIGLESANRINDELKKIGSEWKVSRNDTGNSVYFNILSDKVFNSQKQASEFLQKIGYVGMETSSSNYIIFDDREMNINNRVQYMMSENGEVYGFAYNGEIYADKNLMNSNVLSHEYTHLWDNYTKNTNSELWERGKNVFKQTNIWNEVVNDPSYQNIKNNEDEILSECHARICGKFAQQVLERVAAENGENAKNAVIDWDSEVNEFIAKEFGFTPELGSENYVSDSIKAESLKEFLATPMKDLMAGRGFENRLEREPLNINQEHSKFDEELYLFNNGQLDENHIFNLGIPGEILKNCGFPENDRIELAASRLKIKASQGNHPFEIMDILGLDKALQNPIAVFEYGDKEKSQNVIVNLEKDGKNFLVGVFFNQKKDGFEVSSIRGLFNRDNLDWMRWIQQGKMIYGDKERIQVLTNQQRTTLADVNSKEARSSSDLYYLDSLNNILQNFSDVKNIYTKDFPKYAEQKEKFEIFKQFRSAYQETDSINVYDAVKDADEFYEAIKNNDKSIIEKFTNGIEKAELAKAASLILQNVGSHVQLKGINTQALNSNYNKDKLLSTNEIESLNNRENPSPQFMKSQNNENQKENMENKIMEKENELEQEDYIHSEEFIAKFGDWEKANRIERLKNASNLEFSKEIRLEDENLTEQVKSLIENEDRKGILSLEREIGKTIVGNYINNDLNENIIVTNNNIREISHHHAMYYEHIAAVGKIPEIIKNGIFIDDVKNEDKIKHPNIEKYQYFATGIKFGEEYYTCKSVVGIDKNNNCYYDQSLSSIEKGKLIDIIQEKNKLGNLSHLIATWESELLENNSPSAYYDKRLINICQVPQMPYLEMKNGKWQPTKEAIDAVKEGKLFIEKNGQNYIMRDEKQLSTPQFMKSADNKDQELEQEDYIHSEEFIAKFGDWKKAERLEKLRNSESVGISGNEILQAEDLKEYKKNAIQYGKSLRGEYKNIDSGNEILLTASKKGGGIYEILEHDYKDKEHLQSIAAIPQIIENSIYISSEKNEDVQKHPNIDSYEYYLCGLKIANNDYTVKAVVAKTLDGNRYYDHKLTDIEKGKLLDFMKKYSVQTSSVSITTQTPETERFQLKDKRLYQICQCPQINYLNKNLEPSAETIQAVKDGKLYIEKDENGIQILHDENKGLSLGKELSEIFKNQEKHYQSVPEWKKTLNNLMEMAKNEENEKLQNHENKSELSQWYETVDWEDPIESAEAWQNGTQEQIDYIRKRQNEIIDNGIESLQENGGMSEAAIKADIEKSEISEEQSDESEILFDDTNGKPHYPQEIISALENFQKIESSKWNLKTEEKTAVFHLIQITEIEKNDFENSLEKLRNYMNSEEFKKEESNYAKILTPILLTSLGQDFDEKTHTFSSTKFSYKFSTDELKKEVPVEKNIVEKGEIKSVLGNDFTGKNVKLTQDFQNELIEKGIVKPEENFILINEVEAVAYGTKIKENEPFVTLTIPVDNDGKTEFVQTKYYHVSSLEKPQKIEKLVEENAKEVDKADKNIIIYGKTKVPEFAMITQHGLENFKDMIIESYEESTKTYLLKSENNNKNVRISENTLNVLTSKDYAQKAKNYTQDTKTAEKMVETQYKDFFKIRSNCANNFRHNLAIFCRKEANSPLDALKLANSLISQMPKDEKRKTKELLNLLKKDGQSVNEVIIETYHEAVKEVPLNEDYLNNKRYEKMISRPMYDTISTKGEKIDRDFNLKIGDSVQMSFKVNKNPLSKFSLKKENLNQTCTIISSSKEGNMVTVMDGNKSFYDVPRDTFLKEYAKKQKVENKMEKKVHRQMSMQIDIGR